MKLSIVFLTTANIKGTEVIAQQTFTLTQEAVDLEFEGYGFKLHVPEHSLPPEVSETQLNVQISLSGQFQLPTNCELISAVYWVSSPHKFIKPITVEIQHCAALSSGKQCFTAYIRSYQVYPEGTSLHLQRESGRSLQSPQFIWQLISIPLFWAWHSY